MDLYVRLHWLLPGSRSGGSAASRTQPTQSANAAASGGAVSMRSREQMSNAERGLAEPHRLLQHRIEHWRQVAGRRLLITCNTSAGRRLLLPGFRARQQPRVLSRSPPARRSSAQRDLLAGRTAETSGGDVAEQRPSFAARSPPARYPTQPACASSARRSRAPRVPPREWCGRLLDHRPGGSGASRFSPVEMSAGAVRSGHVDRRADRRRAAPPSQSQAAPPISPSNTGGQIAGRGADHL